MSKLSQVLSWLAAPLLACGLLVLVYVSWPQPRQPAAPPLEGCNIHEVVAHLRSAGLAIRLVPTGKDKVVSCNAFLTTTDQEWPEITQLPKLREYIHLWRGTVYVEKGRVDADWSVQAQQWGDCCLVAEPFIFFGDPELLARIGAVLVESGQDEVNRHR